MSKKKAMELIGNKHYTINDVFNAIGMENLELEKPERYGNDEDICFDGFLVHPQSLRYMTFWQKGTVCACCGRKGTYFTLDKHVRDYKGQRRHFNLWSEDGVLMTKDHITPKYEGGKDRVSNLQTMCVICNNNKNRKK